MDKDYKYEKATHQDINMLGDIVTFQSTYAGSTAPSNDSWPSKFSGYILKFFCKTSYLYLQVYSKISYGCH